MDGVICIYLIDPSGSIALFKSSTSLLVWLFYLLLKWGVEVSTNVIELPTSPLNSVFGCQYYYEFFKSVWGQGGLYLYLKTHEAKSEKIFHMYGSHIGISSDVPSRETYIRNTVD